GWPCAMNGRCIREAFRLAPCTGESLALGRCGCGFVCRDGGLWAEGPAVSAPSPWDGCYAARGSRHNPSEHACDPRHQPPEHACDPGRLAHDPRHNAPEYACDPGAIANGPGGTEKEGRRGFAVAGVAQRSIMHGTGL